uniref:TATA element modulatory factor-like n=1 Tax=Crassostrea virginica TaxID=6565 RepID=A0A8B8E3Q6_CRAVI|nr:TATA element modulatory factor-like [Crassostrea virginica]XP_022333947.1 TATA element modulatory factor-like [Crassostrea virginica]XP_022333948.1 TATA element modulatory factor-like [Crassostrea virginica]
MSPFSRHIEKLKGLQEYLEKLICEMTNYRCPNCKDAADDPEDEDATAEIEFKEGESEDTTQGKIPKQDEKNIKKGNEEKSDGCVYLPKYDTQQQKTPSSSISDLQKTLEDGKSKTDKQIDAVDDHESEDVAVKDEFSGGQLEERTQEQAQKQSQAEDKEGEEEKSDAYVHVNKYNTLLKDCEGLSVQQRTLSSKIFDLEKTVEDKESCISYLENTVKNKENQIDELKNIIKGLKDAEKRQQEEISEKGNEIEKCKLIYQNVTDKCKTLKQQVDDNLLKEKELQEKILELNRRIQQLNTEKNDIEKNYREKSRLEERHREQITEKGREISRLQVTLRGKEELIATSERNKSEITERCRWLEQEIERISRAEIAVGFHTTLAATMSSIVLEGLTSRLADRLAMEKVDLVRQPYSGNTDYCWPLLVVCVNVSRIGADAKEALKGIPKGSNKDVALLVFHHKEAHALPSQTSDKILTGSDFNHLGTIIDLAFLSQKGIYNAR